MPPITTLSPFKQHCQKWRDGCGSDQCSNARNRVFYRGKIPCDVLFIGEAPGESEDVLAQPFVGPAGILLNELIARTLTSDALRLGFTNVVCCIPRNEGKKADEPQKKQIVSCQKRLYEIIVIAKPRVIITVGEVSTKWTPQAVEGLDIELVKLLHPAAILKRHVTEQPLLVERVMATLTTVFHELTR